MNTHLTVRPRRLIRSAGALVWRPIGDAVEAPAGTALQPSDIEVLLVHRPRYRDWSWPKGKAELNEPLAQAAVREVEEETGKVVVLHLPMTTQRYRLGSGHTKEVHYWAARLIADPEPRAARPPVVRASRKEIDTTQWVKPGRAKQMLTRRGDRRLLGELLGHAAAGNLDTSTVILLRHGKAVSRNKWTGSEESRPLSRLGGVQAVDLVPLLSAFGANHLSSSPWRRCQQTVGPYSSISRVVPQELEFLSESGFRADPDASYALVKDLMSRTRGSHVVSLHRPSLEALLAPLTEERGPRSFPALEVPKTGLRTGEMFVAHISHSEFHSEKARVIDLERHTTFTKFVLS